ncbi:MAG: substrate-binding domain-containing protein [Bacteroidetes bacterium]|nr:substrate-binding domain-containing protein [Bacteroidota bacterium]
MFKFFYPFLLLGMMACSTASQTAPSDSASEGQIHISVDESFREILEEQIKVYQALQPKTKIIAHYKSEADCWQDLYNDSTRMLIVTKKLNPGETKYYYDSVGVYPESGQLAYDAVALIVNRKALDSVFTQQQVREILTGKSSLPYKPVFDGNRATANFRYAIDSILEGAPADLSRISAAKSGREVIDFIANNPNHIGFVGVSAIGNPEDMVQQRLREKVRIVWVGCRNCAEGQQYSHPAQEEILYNRYPYTRGVYYILKETHAGLGRAFVNFMKKDQGQLIFRRGYLVPAWRPHIVRETEIR